jgi:hypothetical protein
MAKLTEGEAIKRKGWCGFYRIAPDGLIYHNDTTIVELYLQDLEANDWQIVLDETSTT